MNKNSYTIRTRRQVDLYTPTRHYLQVVDFIEVGRDAEI